MSNLSLAAQLGSDLASSSDSSPSVLMDGSETSVLSSSAAYHELEFEVRSRGSKAKKYV
jgi:hypothetical protein